MSRPVFVYRLDVAYPADSSEPGWEPEGWEPDWIAPDETRPFAWPAVRLYLSESGARGRARLLHSYGATVTIHRSLAVEWPT